jgi:hypothetical protein
LLPVAEGQAAASNRDLSDVFGSDLGAGLVQQEHLNVRERIAHRNGLPGNLGIVVEDIHADGSGFGAGQ